MQESPKNFPKVELLSIKGCETEAVPLAHAQLARRQSAPDPIEAESDLEANSFIHGVKNQS
jgi:hypothetical protein